MNVEQRHYLQLGAVLCTACLVLFSAPCPAQFSAGRPVRLVLQGAPASAPDIIVRPIAQRLSEQSGRQFIVDNRPGAAGLVAAQLVAAAPADGHTLLLASSGTMSIAPFLAKTPPYDPVRDFAPVTLVAAAPLVISVHPSLPARSLKDLIATAKTRPNDIRYGTPGVGSVQHLTMELLARAAGMSLLHVPYKSGAPAVVDAMSGQLQMVITAIPAVMPHVKAARLRAMAVTSSSRASAMPEVPSVAESGLSSFESITWYAIYAPRGASAQVLERTYGDVRKATETPAVQAAAMQEGFELQAKGPQHLAELQKLDTAKWQKTIREAKIVLE